MSIMRYQNNAPHAILERSYDIAIARFKKEQPIRAAALTPGAELEGIPWYFPEFQAYMRTKRILNTGTIEIVGAFKFSGRPGFAEVAADFVRSLGCTTVVLDCFEPVADAWIKAGFHTYAVEPFNPKLVPDDWPKGMGEPRVLYMRKHYGG